jgi:hypothetical protein
MRTGLWYRNVNEKDILEDPRVKLIFKKSNGMTRTGFIWLRISTMAGSCERINTTLGATKREISRPSDEALHSQGTLCFMELVVLLLLLLLIIQ